MTTDIPHLAFLPDGDYDLSTLEKRVAAAEATLSVIAMIPMTYYSRGAEFCRDDMAGAAGKLATQLRDARTPVTPEMLTDQMILDLQAATGGVFVAGMESCAVALGVELERAKDQGDEAYYSARMDQDLARQVCCDAINIRRGLNGQTTPV